MLLTEEAIASGKGEIPAMQGLVHTFKIHPKYLLHEFLLKYSTLWTHSHSPKYAGILLFCTNFSALFYERCIIWTQSSFLGTFGISPCNEKTYFMRLQEVRFCPDMKFTFNVFIILCTVYWVICLIRDYAVWTVLIPEVLSEPLRPAAVQKCNKQ